MRSGCRRARDDARERSLRDREEARGDGDAEGRSRTPLAIAPRARARSEVEATLRRSRDGRAVAASRVHTGDGQMARPTRGRGSPAQRDDDQVDGQQRMRKNAPRHARGSREFTRAGHHAEEIASAQDRRSTFPEAEAQ